MTEFVKSKWVHTAKPTICFGCLREFPKGTLMESQTMRDKDGLWSLHLCPTCEMLVDEFVAEDENYESGRFKDIAPSVELSQGDDNEV